MLQEAGHRKNTNVLIFQQIHWLHLMYAETAWVLVSLRTQFQPRVILNSDYLPDYLFVSYDYVLTDQLQISLFGNFEIYIKSL